jgi:hypothetical protein
LDLQFIDLEDGSHRPAAVWRFLAQFPEGNRAEAVHLTLRALRARVEPDRVLACELAWEVHTRGYWSQLKGENGRPYETEESYFRHVLGLASWRTAYKRLAIGRLLTSFEEPERTALRTAIAAAGVAKAAVVVPAVERLGEWRRWLRLAGELSAVVLQAQVSAALQSAPRGREPSPPGERFRRTVLAAMPDIEAMELVERFFDIGARVVGTGHPIAIFLAGCRECLAEWEVEVAHVRASSARSERTDFPGTTSGPAAAPPMAESQSRLMDRFCPRGQTGTAENGRAH